jgi:glutamate 5-kinase
LVANLVEADLLLILTDQQGLFDADPRANPQAKLVSDGAAGDPVLLAMAGGSGALGRGGMRTKIQAAERAAHSGAATVIASGREPDVITRVFAGESLGTYLTPAHERLAARKRWLAGPMRSTGKLVLDDGAVRVIREGGKSLLPVGVKKIEGDFARGDVVVCVDAQGREVARGLVNYGAAEAARIIGQPSDRIEAVLGYIDESELIHRDNMVIV